MINKSLYLLPLVLLACEGESEEAKRIEVPVVVDTSALGDRVTTDLGYVIELTQARMVIEYLNFTRGGEQHEIAGLGWLIGTAHAHPGHLAGGDVLGELKGRFVVDLLGDAGPLGTATLVVGHFDGAGFLFGVGTQEDGGLAGHTLLFEGTAARDGRTVTFTAAVAQDPNRQVVGIPFDTHVTTPRAIGFGLTSPGLFDAIDFFALAGEEANVTLDGAAINRLRRATQSHEHYAVTLEN